MTFIPRQVPLICTPDQIFDHEQVLADCHTSLTDLSDQQAARGQVVAILAAAQAAGRRNIAEAFAQSPHAARPTVAAYSFLTDGLVACAFTLASTVFHRAPTPTEAERIAVFAVGGFGRAEMAPESDVDLLFLSPYKLTAWAESVIETTLYILWDLRLKVGHATRTIPDCLRLAREDHTIRTSLLEHRFLLGDQDLAKELKAQLWSELFEGTAGEFVEAKLAERAERHKKEGGQRYVVEPNVKEGKGGLRDLQSMFWIAKYVHGISDQSALLDSELFSPAEAETFRAAENFLWAVRCHLHLIAGRPIEKLSFDMQVEVAAAMEYRDGGGRRAVEHFMQDYFRHATKVGDLTRIVLTDLEALHVKRAPSLLGFLRRRRRVHRDYRVVNGRLDLARETLFVENPLALLHIFEEALRTGLLIHPNAMRLISGHLNLITDELRQSPEAVRIFLDVMVKHGDPARGLRRMNELGVLAAFLPEFEPIVAMMQFNMYHHYTVDEHTIQCISALAQIERGELVEELPLASGILKAGINRKVLYVALLLHDIGKGRPEDHSILGARIARKICPRLGLKPAECETVEWLVRYHLLMSDMAQKRDIADPRTIRDFAKAVKTRKRLDLLTVLTVCDIRGVGPGTWNNWKAVLLRQLHAQTADALENGLEDLNRGAREAEAKRALRAALPDWSKKLLRDETSRHYGPYWQGLPTAAHVIFANLLRDIPSGEIRHDLKPDEDRDATRACFAMEDHPGIFSRITGALALVGANIVDARTYTSKDGYATAIFWLQDTDGHPYEASRLDRLRQVIDKTLSGDVVARDALKTRDKIKKRERAFRVPTTITFDNDGSDIFTIVEVDTRDRAGLLHDLTRTLADANISLSSATIATYGEQVVDSFYVKDMFGLKIQSASKQAALEKRLRDAIAQGAARARAD